MNYKHLSIEERSCIRKYYVDGLSYREIARLLGRNPSTITREFKRNRTHMYDMWIVNSKSDRFGLAKCKIDLLTIPSCQTVCGNMISF